MRSHDETRSAFSLRILSEPVPVGSEADSGVGESHTRRSPQERLQEGREGIMTGTRVDSQTKVLAREYTSVK